MNRVILLRGGLKISVIDECIKALGELSDESDTATAQMLELSHVYDKCDNLMEQPRQNAWDDRPQGSKGRKRRVK